jgi:hypothetical protein
MKAFQDPKTLRAEILRLSRDYSSLMHAAQRPGWDPLKSAFQQDETVIPYAGRVFDEEEVEAAVASTLDFWLTLGPEGEAFEKELAAWMGVRHSVLVNSGSSANLVAFATLTSPKIPANRRLEPGDEVITCAAGFPTTVAPIMQHGCVNAAKNGYEIFSVIHDEVLSYEHPDGWEGLSAALCQHPEWLPKEFPLAATGSRHDYYTKD